MKYYADFSRSKWNPDDFWHAGFYSIPHRKPFEQEDDCITNGLAPDFFKPDPTKMVSDAEIAGMDHNDFAFTAYITKQKFVPTVNIKSDFSFESFGAPTYAYGTGVEKDEEMYVYQTQVEVTLWEEGINYWHIELKPEEKIHKVTLLKHDKFELAGGRHYIEIDFTKNGISVNLDGRESNLDFPLFDEGYVGFIGCEGMNRFYYLDIEEKD